MFVIFKWCLPLDLIITHTSFIKGFLHYQKKHFFDKISSCFLQYKESAPHIFEFLYCIENIMEYTGLQFQEFKIMETRR